ncbi:MAG TPA: caspase family protein, partial [Acidimicrobiales bacterium]
MGSYRALLIGNSSFPADPHNLRPLAGPVNDVAVLRAALTDPAVGLFEPESVRLVPERTAPEILVELERFFSSARRDDTLLLYYSGHGLLNERNQLFLCARDTRTDLLKSTAVGAAAINLMFEESAARTTVIVLDCCHSGAFKSGNLADSLRGSGRFLLTSCRSSDLASDATRENATSVFTNHLVHGLLQGADDSD